STLVSVVRAPAPQVSPPTVLGVQRFGIHEQLTRLVLRFSTPLDGSRALDPGRYQIVGPDGRTIAVDFAEYDPVGMTVTLHPHDRLNVHRRYVLTVIGTGARGLAGSSGVLLDGARTGRPGSNFTTVV